MGLTRNQLWMLGALALAGAAYWYWQQQGNASNGTSDDSSGTADGSDSSSTSSALSDVVQTVKILGSRVVNAATSRGYRNNNPGNMEFIAGDPFNGQTGQDGRYAIYDTPQNGTRALGHQLMNYANAGCSSVSDFITKWAPPPENDTAAYIADVCGQMNVGATDALDLSAQLGNLAQAIAKHENGYIDTSYDFQDWVNLP